MFTFHDDKPEDYTTVDEEPKSSSVKHSSAFSAVIAPKKVSTTNWMEVFSFFAMGAITIAILSKILFLVGMPKMAGFFGLTATSSFILGLAVQSNNRSRLVAIAVGTFVGYLLVLL